jgi:tetratricopeptide (TPR) repeat protein
LSFERLDFPEMTFVFFYVKLFFRMKQLDNEWINGRVTLGAAANWSAEEIRIVSELGFALAQQGRNLEAISIFEGLTVLAPSTIYFNGALGSLWLREKKYKKALNHLNIAVEANRRDIPARLNRGETLLRLGKLKESSSDLEFVAQNNFNSTEDPTLLQCQKRAKALLLTIPQS